MDLDDLRKRVMASKLAAISKAHIDLIEGLWRVVQEQHATIERLRAEIELVSK